MVAQREAAKAAKEAKAKADADFNPYEWVDD